MIPYCSLMANRQLNGPDDETGLAGVLEFGVDFALGVAV
jgi:hypothetical protein